MCHHGCKMISFKKMFHHGSNMISRQKNGIKEENVPSWRKIISVVIGFYRTNISPDGILVILGGGVPHRSSNLPLFQTKKCHFHTPVFSPCQTSKIYTRFQTQPLDRNYVIITQIRPQKHSSNEFRIGLFLLLSYSFGIETINNKLIYSRSSVENHTRFLTKMDKLSTCLQTKKAQKLYPLGRLIPTSATWFI